MLNPMKDDKFDAILKRRPAKEDDAVARDPAALPADVADEDAEIAEESANVADSDAADLLAMKSALGNYRKQSLAWAEQRSARMPSPLPATPRTAWLQARQWALGLAALCACAIGGAVYTHHQAADVDIAAEALPIAPTLQALAADNQLLASVNNALRGADAPSEQELGLTEELFGDKAQTRPHARQRSSYP